MKLFLATKLTVEQCTQRLHNAIDPIPPSTERVNSANNTTWSTDPLPGAGQRTTGFGYSPGTRPVVGALQDGKFRLEKRVVKSGLRNAPPVIGAVCNGHVQPAPYGTLIELEVERPGSSVVFIFFTGLFAAVFGLVGLVVLYTYLTGTQAPTAKGDPGGFGCCILVMLFALFPLVLSLIAQQTGNAEREYLLKFVKLVCQAASLEAQEADTERGYTGKTQRLS
jgi:hypothetical protein